MTRESLEPQVRSLVSRQLGVGIELIVFDVSLRDDLAVDSLDLIELALALETAFAITMPDRLLDKVRTYGDLVEATGLLVRRRCAA